MKCYKNNIRMKRPGGYFDQLVFCFSREMFYRTRWKKATKIGISADGGKKVVHCCLFF